MRRTLKCTVANLRNMRQFFLSFEKRYTLCSECGVNLSDADIR